MDPSNDGGQGGLPPGIDGDDASSTDGHGPGLKPGDSFPGYEILRELSRGGQGVVYQALQLSTKRKVAIKLLHSGRFLGEPERARFERETYILAQMRHPNIVRIFDSGRTASGGVFYVMDYIPGKTLDVWVKDHPAPPIVSTLRMFVKLCRAVREVHVRAVIHRDIKPSNIKVTPDGEPILLDFGYARPVLGDLLDERDGPETTPSGLSILSVPWSSPEQTEGSAFEVDARTDIHALGLVLYQMLTGQFPYSVSGELPQVLKNIVSADARRPSSVRSDIDADLDAIILHCLRKRREERYQSAGKLAEDIEHYLNDEPISVRPPSLRLLLRSLTRRHRTPVVAASVGVIVLGMGFVGTLWGFTQARNEAQRAREERDRAVKIGSFLRETLLAANPFASGGADGSLSVHSLLSSPGHYAGSAERRAQVDDLMIDAASRLPVYFSKEAAVRADLSEALGVTLNALDRYAESGELFKDAIHLGETSLGPDDPLVLRAKLNYGWQLAFMSRNSEAGPYLDGAYKSLLERLGPADLLTLRAAQGYAINLDALGEGDRAVGFLQKCVDDASAKKADERDVLATKLELGKLLARNGKMDEGGRLLKECVDRCRTSFGPADPHTRDAVHKLIIWASDYKPDKEYEVMARDVMRQCERASPADAAGLTQAQEGLVAILTARRQFDEAAPLAESLVQARERQFGPNSRYTAYARIRLARLQADTPATAASAEATTRQCKEALRQFDPDDGDLHKCNELFCAALITQKRYAEAAAELERALPMAIQSRKSFTQDNVPNLRCTYARCLLALGRVDDAERQVDEAEKKAAVRFGAASPAWRRVIETRLLVARARGDATQIQSWQAELDRMNP